MKKKNQKSSKIKNLNCKKKKKKNLKLFLFDSKREGKKSTLRV